MENIISKIIISANINDSISKVSEMMKLNNIGFIPVKENDKYVGVITDRDIALAIPNLKSINDPIKDYITKNIISIEHNSTIDDALKIMSINKVKRLLVKNKDNTIGVLSLSDILNYTNNSNILDTYRSIFFINDNKGMLLSKVDDFEI